MVYVSSFWFMVVDLNVSVPPGNEKLLKDLCVGQREKFSQTDSRGWTPLHEAAAQSNQTILELTYRGLSSLNTDSVQLRKQRRGG